MVALCQSSDHSCLWFFLIFIGLLSHRTFSSVLAEISETYKMWHHRQHNFCYEGRPLRWALHAPVFAYASKITGNTTWRWALVGAGWMPLCPPEPVNDFWSSFSRFASTFNNNERRRQKTDRISRQRELLASTWLDYQPGPKIVCFPSRNVQ